MTTKEKAKDSYLHRLYGITLIEFRTLQSVFGGRCWRCKRMPKSGRSLNVDHLHVKGYKDLLPALKRLYVRGLLCFYCNKYRIGSIKDPVEFDRSAEYLRNNKAQEILSE